MKKLLSLIFVTALVPFCAHAIDTAVAVAASAEAKTAVVTTYAERLDRGKQIAGAVCLACHGLNGYSPISANPNIAGMPSEYIAKQLELYKSGKRVNAIMQGMSANLTPADMRALGDYYFAQRGTTAAIARDKALAERGQQIWRVGIAEAKVPACAGCHGASGLGIPSSYPRLAGQWPEYTHAQLKNYISGTRANTQMQTIATRMKESDLLAVSEYIAGMRTK